jgi:trehalose 6-phosphate phosphatase
MTTALFENLQEVRDRLEGRRLLLFLDFDGTLTPIVERSCLAQLAPETRELLDSLSRTERLSLAVISGRALADVQARVGIPTLIYAGNHGLEIGGVGFHFIEPIAAARRDELLWLSDGLAAELRDTPGVEVEFKGLTSTVHFRRTPANQASRIPGIVKAAIRGREGLFVLSPGKKSVEIRPRVNWHKGRAAAWICAKLNNGALPIYIGDDVTDEDAFLALSEGITVKVGEGTDTAARYHLASPDQVAEFLHWLADALVPRTVSESA